MAGKRGNSEGSITKRPDGRWEARISLDGGRRKSHYAKTRQEASRWLAEALRDRDKGLPIVGEKQTVEHYLTQWLKDIEPTVGPRTLQRYEEIVRLHLLPTLGGIILSKLSAQHVQAFYTAKRKEGLAPATVGRLHVVLHRALNEAMRLGLIQRNVATLVTPPRVERKEMKVLSPAQARAFCMPWKAIPLRRCMSWRLQQACDGANSSRFIGLMLILMAGMFKCALPFSIQVGKAITLLSQRRKAQSAKLP